MTSSRSTSAAVSRANVMRPTRGSSSTSSATASATLTRIGRDVEQVDPRRRLRA